MQDIKVDITEPIYLKHLVAITTALIATGRYTEEPDEKHYGIIKTTEDSTLVSCAAESILFDLILNAQLLAEHKADFDEKDEDPERN